MNYHELVLVRLITRIVINRVVVTKLRVTRIIGKLDNYIEVNRCIHYFFLSSPEPKHRKANMRRNVRY